VRGRKFYLRTPDDALKVQRDDQSSKNLRCKQAVSRLKFSTNLLGKGAGRCGGKKKRGKALHKGIGRWLEGLSLR